MTANNPDQSKSTQPDKLPGVAESPWRGWDFRTLAVVAVAGIAIGAAGWLLKWMIAEVTHIAFTTFSLRDISWHFIPLALIAIIAVAWLVRTFVKSPLDDPTAILRRQIQKSNGIIAPGLAIWTLITSSLTLGCGGSAGSAGPIAFTGAAIAGNVGRWLRANRKLAVPIMACGGGAGIAAIFQSPVGGFFFTIEVLGISLGGQTIVMLAAMCVAAGETAWLLSGLKSDMVVTQALYFDSSMIWGALIIGLSGGIYSAYYRATGLATRRVLKRFAHPLAANIVSGLFLGGCLFLFPSLYGEGYGVLGALADGFVNAATEGSPVYGLSGNSMIWTLAGILAVKGMACYATNSGGGIAGNFAPTLFAGGILGALSFVVFGNLGFMHQIPSAVMILCGMGAVMAGIIRAPLMALFIVTEMTGAWSLVVPVGISVGISYIISRAIGSRKVMRVIG